jgi:hypothetical protein
MTPQENIDAILDQIFEDTSRIGNISATNFDDKTAKRIDSQIKTIKRATNYIGQYTRHSC